MNRFTIGRTDNRPEPSGDVQSAAAETGGEIAQERVICNQLPEDQLAAAVATRLAPQLQRIEQMLQDLQRQQQQQRLQQPLQQPWQQLLQQQQQQQRKPETALTSPASTCIADRFGDQPMDDAISFAKSYGDESQAPSRSGKDGDSGAGRSRTVHLHITDEPEMFKLPEEPTRNSALARFMLSGPVERFILVAIVANVFVSISKANRKAATLSEDVTRNEEILELICLGVFIVELVLKLAVHRLYFFINTDMWWNWFDLVIVIASMAEQVMALMGSGGLSFAFARVYRVYRVCKVLRVVRALKFLSDLRMMAACVMSSAMPLLWCCVLLLIVNLIFAMMFIHLITEYRIGHPEICVDDPDMCEALRNSFSSVQAAMLTLFMTTTGGCDWGEVYDLVRMSGPHSGVLFLLFIVFFMFAFFNIVTALFLDRVLSKAQPDHEEKMLKKRHEDMAQARELKALIMKLDKEGIGIITEAEVQKFQHDEEVLESLELAGLNVTDMHSFFNTLCKSSGSKALDIDTFVESAFKMKGAASAIDVQTLLFGMADVRRYLRRMEKKVEDNSQAAFSIISAGSELLREPGRDLHMSAIQDARMKMGPLTL